MEIEIGMYKNLLFLIFFYSSFSLACECHVNSENVKENILREYSYSSIVVLVEAIKIKNYLGKVNSSTRTKVESQKVTWKIIKKWKGAVVEEGELITDTITECCMCGVSIGMNEKRILYLQSEILYKVSSCSVSSQYSIAEQKQSLDSL